MMNGRLRDSALMAAAGVASALATWAMLRPRPRRDLRDQVVLVTGASRGLGLALTREFAAAGCRLVLCARDPVRLQAAADDAARMGAEVLAVPCDVSDQAQVESLVSQATARFGRIDVVVNNAGILVLGPVQALAIEDYRDSMAVMFFGPLYVTTSVLPQMLERQGGCIVNITSVGGKMSSPHFLAYSPAKFAAVGFSDGLRAELAAEGIDVITVVPSFMRTGAHDNATFKGQHRAEYTWFSIASSLPMTSTSAAGAARRIVRGVERRAGQVEIGLEAIVGPRLYGLFPRLSVGVIGLINRLLPDADGAGRQRVSGKASRTALSMSFITRLGQRAMRTYRQ